MKATQRCGQYIGYFDHRKHETAACPACLQAYAAWMRDYRHRTRRNTHHLVKDETP